MKRFSPIFFVSLVACVFLSFSVYATDFDFSGTFTNDDDVVLLNFTVGSDSQITIFSSSWGNGVLPSGYVLGDGFDPILAIWDDSGMIVEEQDDGEQVGSTLSNGVEYSYGEYDSFFEVDLASGQYIASITQYDNFRVSDRLSDGFKQEGDPNFTFNEGYGSQPKFNGVWDDNDPRNGFWEFHILNVDAASGPGPSPVPEPTTVVMLGLGLFVLAGLKRKLVR